MANMSPFQVRWVAPELRRYRVERMLTQQELADKAGVALATVTRIETGYAARIDTIRKLAKALGCHPRDLAQPAGADAEGNE
jgi:transcriptional regulator with XRE-family HTH domain